jgi:hypothetical protein
MPPSRPDDNDDHVNGDDEAMKTEVMTTAATAKATTTQQQGDNNGTSPNDAATIATWLGDDHDHNDCEAMTKKRRDGNATAMGRRRVQRWLFYYL